MTTYRFNARTTRFAKRYATKTRQNIDELARVGSMTIDEHKRYVRLWSWSAIRHSGDIAMMQERFIARHERAGRNGFNALDRRIGRIIDILAALRRQQIIK